MSMCCISTIESLFGFSIPKATECVAYLVPGLYKITRWGLTCCDLVCICIVVVCECVWVLCVECVHVVCVCVWSVYVSMCSISTIESLLGFSIPMGL